MPGERRGLGKGLEALIPSAPGVNEVAVDSIVPNPKQPRQKLDQEALQELANSIREQGVVQPLVVTRVEGGYQLLVGERRWRAAKLAGLEVVQVVVREVSPQQMLELALVENLQRADLNPLEEASAYQSLVEEFGLTQEVVAARVGKSRVAVTNAMRLLRLPVKAKEAIMAGEIREGHGRALLGLPSDELIEQALQMIIDGSLSVRQTEELVRRMSQQAAEPRVEEPAEEETSPETRELERRFRDVLGTKVNLYRSHKGRGRLVIHFYSEEELQTIYDVIVGGG